METATTAATATKKSFMHVGLKGYFFLLPYHHIGTVAEITDEEVRLTDVIAVSNAGPEDDAVRQIVAGQKQPANFEFLDELVFPKHSLAQYIRLTPDWKLSEVPNRKRK